MNHFHLYHPRAEGQYNDPAHRVLTCEHTEAPYDECDCAACEEARTLDAGTHVACESCGDVVPVDEATTYVRVALRGRSYLATDCAACNAETEQ